MAGIDSVLERLVTDPSFRKLLRDDPTRALDGYELNQDDLDLLAAQLDDSGGANHGVEQRTSKSALFGLLAAASDATGGPTGGTTTDAGQEETDWDFINRAPSAEADHVRFKMRDTLISSYNISGAADQGAGDIAAGKITPAGMDDAAASSSDAELAADDGSTGGYDDYLVADSWSWGSSPAAADGAEPQSDLSAGDQSVADHDEEIDILSYPPVRGTAEAEPPGDVAAQSPSDEGQVPTETMSFNYQKVDVEDADTPGLADPGKTGPDQADDQVDEG